MKSQRISFPVGCLLAALIVSTAAAAACSDRPTPLTAARDLAHQLGPGGPPPPSPPPTSGQAGDILIYVDASMSMAGYVGCSRPTEFDIVLDHFATALGLSSVTLFGERAGIPLFTPRPLDRSVHCPQVYNRLQNPDYRLIEALDSLGTALYFTDGVQSSAAITVPSPSMRAMRDWLLAGRAIGIFAFRSSFDGEAWSEQRNSMIGHVQHEARPFYVFLFAPSARALDDVIDRLPNDVVDPAVQVRFEPRPPTCRIQTAALAADFMTDPAWAYIPREEARHLATARRPIGALQCDLAAHSPAQRVQAAVGIERYFEWTGSGYEASPMVPAAQFWADRFDTASAGTGSGLMLEARVSTSNVSNHGFFHLAITPRAGSLRDDLQALNTPDDSELANFDRTYRIGWLLDYLLRAQFERTVIHSYSLTLEYR